MDRLAFHLDGVPLAPLSLHEPPGKVAPLVAPSCATRRGWPSSSWARVRRRRSSRACGGTTRAWWPRWGAANPAWENPFRLVPLALDPATPPDVLDRLLRRAGETEAPGLPWQLLARPGLAPAGQCRLVAVVLAAARVPGVAGAFTAFLGHPGPGSPPPATRTGCAPCGPPSRPPTRCSTTRRLRSRPGPSTRSTCSPGRPSRGRAPASPRASWSGPARRPPRSPWTCGRTPRRRPSRRRRRAPRWTTRAWPTRWRRLDGRARGTSASASPRTPPGAAARPRTSSRPRCRPGCAPRTTPAWPTPRPRWRRGWRASASSSGGRPSRNRTRGTRALAPLRDAGDLLVPFLDQAPPPPADVPLQEARFRHPPTRDQVLLALWRHPGTPEGLRARVGAELRALPGLPDGARALFG